MKDVEVMNMKEEVKQILSGETISNNKAKTKEEMVKIVVDRMKERYTAMPNELNYDTSISFGAKALFGVFKNASWYDSADRNTTRISNEIITILLGITENSIRKYIKELKEHKIIDVLIHHKASIHYKYGTERNIRLLKYQNVDKNKGK